MPRRKKLPTVPNYTGTARKENEMLVQKSNPLQSLSETGMSLAEFKILDAYLSRIDSHKPDARYVRFEKGELEKLLGVTKILQPDLEARLDGLFRTVTIRDGAKSKGFTKIALFEKAEAVQDKNGLWQVDLACTASAMEYVFNIDNLGYLKYRLKNVIDLTSRYSYVLYLYLENNRFRKTWNVPLAELKAMLRCTADTYKQYYRFNDLILKKCHKELNEKTSLKFSYKPVKKGRSVEEVCFTIETLSDEELDYNQLTLDQMDEEQRIEQEQKIVNEQKHKERLNFLNNATGDIFTPEQMEVICLLLADNPNVPSFSYGGQSVELARYNYLARLVAKMNEVEKRKGRIKDKFAYITAILRKENENS